LDPTNTDSTDTFEPADVFLTQGKGPLSRAIRFFSRGIGESRTMVNHVGIVVESGPPRRAVVVEALSRVKRHRIWERYGPPSGDSVAVYRAKNLSQEEIATIVTAAESYVGRNYGYFKILAHLLDWLLLGAYGFRRLARMDKYPICSWLVAHSFAKAHKHFGVEPGAANPDDIWDFVQEHPAIYEPVHPLQPLQNGARS
jgi:hypothetical protein